VIATGIGGFSEIANAVHTTDERGPRRLSPFTILFLANLAAGHVSIAHGFRGPIGAPVTACAASAQAIGDAARMIRSGEADIALCGGAEAAIHRVSLAGFAAARALSSAYSDQPEARPAPLTVTAMVCDGRRRRAYRDRISGARAGAGPRRCPSWWATAPAQMLIT
jgi:3-oxoacyl-[acyl-carrier-protein] synthase II